MKANLHPYNASECISGPNQEGCEEIEISSGEGEPCDQSTYGCCPDGVTMATGPNEQGCYSVVIGRTDDVDLVPDVSGKSEIKVGHCDILCCKLFQNIFIHTCI